MLLAAQGLRKVYRRRQGDLVVLDDCDFTLAAGEAVAITGPSGSGKSTFLNLLGGLDTPTDGLVQYDGWTLPRGETSALCAWRNRTIGFVFQFHFLLPDFSAWENLLLPARMAGGSLAPAAARAQELLAAMGLSERAEHLPGELSGGEQQRVAVARAFMNSPRIVFADEPFGNLDHAKGEELSELLFALRRREGTALVIVTHDRRLAARADRVLSLREGRLSSTATSALT